MRARVKTKVACLTSVGWEGAIKSLIADQIAWTACYREEEEKGGRRRRRRRRRRRKQKAEWRAEEEEGKAGLN